MPEITIQLDKFQYPIVKRVLETELSAMKILCEVFEKQGHESDRVECKKIADSVIDLLDDINLKAEITWGKRMVAALRKAG